MSEIQIDLGGSDKHSKAIWNNLLRAVGAEPKDTLTIQGKSGIEHPVQALGVDEKYGRVVVVAAEQNPRIAALMQGDIQARMLDARVLIARPVAFDIASLARNFIGQFGQVEFNSKEFERALQKLRAEDGTYPGLKEFVAPLIGPTILAFQKVTLPPLDQIFEAIQQLTLIDWESVAKKAKEDSSYISIPLHNLISLDSMQIDRRLGVCPIPLYELSEQDWEIFLAGPHLETLQERLKAFSIYQYFFRLQIRLHLASLSVLKLQRISSQRRLSLRRRKVIRLAHRSLLMLNRLRRWSSSYAPTIFLWKGNII